MRDQFEYETTRTHVHSSVNDILKSGGGVSPGFCPPDDWLVAAGGRAGALRLGLPRAALARGRRIGEQASHAWLEAWLPGPGWTGFDPTHRCRTDERHLGMAIGRDYGDVPPIRGSYSSQGEKSWMRVDLNIARTTDADSADGPLKLQSQQ